MTAGMAGWSACGSVDATAPYGIPAKVWGTAGGMVPVGRGAAAASVETDVDAAPEATAAVPSDASPSKNSTVPAASGVTVAVSATVDPSAAVPVGDAARFVVVAVGAGAATGADSVSESSAVPAA